MVKNLPKISWILVLLVAVVSCIKFIYEPDIWWQIATGNWILEQGQVPTVDVFSYTYENEPWINVKWGAEVLMALVDRTLGVELLPLLQMLCILGILFFIKRIYFQFLATNMNETSKKKIFGLVIASLLALFIVNFRMNSRPEMFSHLFSMVLLFLILHHKKSNSAVIFLLIPLQIIWTNIHEAYGIGMVVMVIFLVSFWIEALYLNPKYQIGISFKPIKYTLASILAILAIAVNPNGSKMITHPFNILGQLSDNKFTEELIAVGTEGYWKFQSVFMVVVVLYLLVRLFKKSPTPLLLRPFQQLGLGYSVVLAAFFYLSLTSFRNIPFFIFVATPVLGYLLFPVEQSRKKTSSLYGIALLLSVVFYFSLTTNVYYQNLLPNEQYGLKVDAEQNPIGAANFIKENKLTGKSFVDYLSSSYFIYEVPNFKSYLDLRDLDVFPTNFFQNVFTVYFNPTASYQGQTVWEFTDSIDTFNYVVLLNNKEMQPLNLYLLHQNQEFSLVYGNLLNSVYVRKTPENEALIKQFGWDQQNAVFNKTEELPPNQLGTVISTLFWPFYSSTSTVNTHLNRDNRAFHNYLQLQ